jgi:hypothetical protein
MTGLMGAVSCPPDHDPFQSGTDMSHGNVSAFINTMLGSIKGPDGRVQHYESLHFSTVC